MFFSCEKNDTCNQKPWKCLSFAQNSRLLQRRFASFQGGNFSRRVFLVKKRKTSQKFEWNSFVCFTVDQKKKQTLEGRKNNSLRENWNRTRRKLKLYFSLEFVFYLIFKPAILPKFTHFQLWIRNRRLLRLLVILGLPHILTLVIFLTNISLRGWYFDFVVISRCVAANFGILERLTIKRSQNGDCLSLYIINTRPNRICFVRVFTHLLFCIRNLTRSLRSLVLFLIRQQLVRKYRTPALSMKYSLYFVFLKRDREYHAKYRIFQLNL